nr:cysteine-rich motor neuron 1 protein-like [Biomphalaria glabrata]
MNWFTVCCLMTLAFTLSTQQENCPHDEVLFEDGYSYNPDPFARCVCTKGQFECVGVMCEKPTCKDNERPVVRMGGLCPRCPENENVAIGESYN